MHRTCALFLLTVMAWLLVAPMALAGAGDAHLPACCRKGATHHCMGGPIGEHGEYIRALERRGAALHGAPCMLLPHRAFALLLDPGFVAPSPALDFHPSTAPFVSTGALEGHARSLAIRTPRGPPSSLIIYG